MNRLLGKISKITSHEGLMLLDIKVGNFVLKSVVIGEPSSYDYMQENKSVHLLFKETEVILARDSSNISLQNQLDCTIRNIEKGVILSRVMLDFQGVELISVITSSSVERLGLNKGERITAMIKTNELLITE